MLKKMSILKYPDWDKSFILYTNISNVGMRIILSQKDKKVKVNKIL